MFFSQETLGILLASRHELYVQLGLVDGYAAAAQDNPIFSTRSGNAVTMGDLIEGLEGQIGDINRQIAQFRGPILDEAVLAADPV